MVPPRDPESLRDALKTMLLSHDLRAAMGARGVETARRYAWPAIAARLEEIYGSLVGPGRVTADASAPGERAPVLLSAEA